MSQVYKCQDCEHFDEGHRICIDTGELTIAVAQACENFDGGFKTCGFCHHWNDYHRTCTITGDRKLHGEEACDMYDLDTVTVAEYERFLQKERLAGELDE